jgi:hypothetical protein
VRGLGGWVVNVGLGVWLFLSALAWPHSASELYGGAMTGVLVVTFALAALGGQRWGRYVTAALGAWLVFMPILLAEPSRFARINHPLVGAAIAVLALWPKGSRSAFLASWGGTLTEYEA